LVIKKKSVTTHGNMNVKFYLAPLPFFSQLTLISAGYSVHLLCVGRVPSDKVCEHPDRSVW